ncbi:hypothetical protein FQR65_LT13442 [Abscondita terminalis]|nr:hypothetical protein FQR65_LT13442 [Abscondita terminalis]
MKVLVTILLIVLGTTVFGNSYLNECIARTVMKVFPKNESIIYVCGDDAEFPIIDDNPRILIDTKTQITIPSTYKNYSQNYVLRAHYLNDLVWITQKLFSKKLTRAGTFLIVTFEQNLEAKGRTNVFTSDPQAHGNNCGLTLKKFLSFYDCLAPTPIQLPKKLRKYTDCNVTHATWISTSTPRPKIKLYASIEFLFNMVVKKLNVSLKMLNIVNMKYSLDLFTVYDQFRKPLFDHEYTSTFYADSMIWIVPFPQRIPHMKIIKLVFKNVVWFFALAVFIGASLTWWLIVKVLDHKSSIAKAFLQVFSITLFGFVDKFYLARPMQCLLVTYVLYSIHIQTAFTSKLIEVLTIPQYEPSIKTLNELGESNVTIFTNELYYSNFFKHEEPNSTLYNLIKKKFEVLPSRNFAKIITNMETYKDKAVLVSSSELEILTALFHTDFCIIKEHTLISRAERVLNGRPGSYILKTIDVLIKKLVESGILEHIAKNDKYKVSIKNKMVLGIPTVLSLQHLYVVFVFWGAGLSLSAMVVVFECVCVHIIK